ncbi:MAG: RNA 2',3'-cyclic phosphodiesterase [Granulosicoccus sp.]
MRAFFALIPDTESALKIEHWRQQNWPLLDRPVPAVNLHLTLSFLGDVSEAQTDELCQMLLPEQRLQTQIRFDNVGYWDKSEILFLAPADVDPEIHSIAMRCKTAAARAGIRVSKKRWQPHMTLGRRVALPPPSPLIAPDFVVSFDGFSLQQSILDRKQARYLCRATF